MVFLDLKKAFDTVDHGILLPKLHAYGIQRVACDWFKSHLSNRMQKCSVNGFFHTIKHCTVVSRKGLYLDHFHF